MICENIKTINFVEIKSSTVPLTQNQPGKLILDLYLDNNQQHLWF